MRSSLQPGDLGGEGGPQAVAIRGRSVDAVVELVRVRGEVEELVPSRRVQDVLVAPVLQRELLARFVVGVRTRFSPGPRSELTALGEPVLRRKRVVVAVQDGQ